MRLILLSFSSGPAELYLSAGSPLSEDRNWRTGEERRTDHACFRSWSVTEFLFFPDVVTFLSFGPLSVSSSSQLSAGPSFRDLLFGSRLSSRSHTSAQHVLVRLARVPAVLFDAAVPPSFLATVVGTVVAAWFPDGRYEWWFTSMRFSSFSR